MFKQRIRINYSIGGDQRFLSHRDTMRLWLRALRRTDLPLKMSEGFHVRPRVSFAQARGVGIASESEWLEVELSDWVNPEAVHGKLAVQLPAGVAIRQLSNVAPNQRAIVRQAAYVVHLPTVPADFPQRLAELLSRPTLVVERGEEERRRQIDIRPLLLSLRLADHDLEIVAECRNEGALKPEEVLAALALSPDDIARSLIVRTASRLTDEPTPEPEAR